MASQQLANFETKKKLAEHLTSMAQPMMKMITLLPNSMQQKASNTP